MKSIASCMTILGALVAVGGLSGCAGYEVNTKKGAIPGYYIHSEMQQSERAVDTARSAGKDKECPAEFKAAEDAKNKAYDVYRACHTEEGIALAKKAASMVDSLCPPKPVAPKPVPVVVPPPALPKATISANPASIEKSGTTTLAWSSENASECTIMPGVGSVSNSGSKVVSPAASTTYKIACKGDGGTAESSTAVNVTQPPADSDKDGVIDTYDKCPNTPLGTKVDKDGCPVIECKSAKIDIDFATNKYEILPSHHAELDKVAAKLNKFLKATAAIEGNTDNVGSPAYNQKLSERRANAVKNYLTEKHGIAANRLSAKGFGETKPVDTNKTAEGRSKNRRVDSVFTCPE